MTPNEIQSKQFDKAMSGYRPDEVHTYLSAVADYVERLQEDKGVLEQKLMVLAEKLEEYREDEDSLRAALIGAQKLGDSVVRESKRKAEQILAEAQQKADSMLVNIRVNIDRETDVLNKMQAEVARFKGQMLSMYKQHIESINSIPYDEKHYSSASEKKAAFEKATEPEPEAEHIEAAPDAEPAQQMHGKAALHAAVHKDFVVTIEEDEELIYDEIAEITEDPPKKESRHGDLQFGEKYTLTRKE